VDGLGITAGYRGSEGGLDRAANVLEARTDEIVAAYEARLLGMNSPLVAEPGARDQLKAQARRILGDVASSLRGEAGTAPGPEDDLSASIGTMRASEGVHASESLRAVAAALSEAALSAVVDGLPPSGTSRREVAAVALAIQGSIMERVARASVSYVGYLLGKMHESHADERRRVGRELHDRVAHPIMVVFRSLELYELYESQDPLKAREKLEFAKDTAQEALKTVRGLSSELRTSVTEKGLRAALTEYLRLALPTGTQAVASVAGDETLLAPEVRDEMFLVVREAIRNATAHSSARTISVEVDILRDLIRAVVEDDGRGFDPEEVTKQAGGTGLSSMRERALILGGSLDVVSGPAKGTRVEVSVPIARTRS
jgi:signal transduction histidine kinase